MAMKHECPIQYEGILRQVGIGHGQAWLAVNHESIIWKMGNNPQIKVN